MKLKITRRKFIEAAGAVLPIAAGLKAAGAEEAADAGAGPGRLALWYEKPASRWVEALPVGNGRLGAMVFGGTGSERPQLNEDTLYAGGPVRSEQS